MNKISILIIALFFLNNCSFNENSKIWKGKSKDKNLINKENSKKLFVEEEIISTQFNPELEINLTQINNNNDITINRNNNGSQNYRGLLKKDNLYISLMYIDCNHYVPSLTALKCFQKNFSKGALIVVDESRIGGENKALKQFCNENNLTMKTGRFGNHNSSYTKI